MSEKNLDLCKECPERPYWPNCDDNFPCPYVVHDDIEDEDEDEELEEGEGKMTLE